MADGILVHFSHNLVNPMTLSINWQVVKSSVPAKNGRALLNGAGFSSHSLSLGFGTLNLMIEIILSASPIQQRFVECKRHHYISRVRNSFLSYLHSVKCQMERVSTVRFKQTKTKQPVSIHICNRCGWSYFCHTWWCLQFSKRFSPITNTLFGVFFLIPSPQPLDCLCEWVSVCDVFIKTRAWCSQASNRRIKHNYYDSLNDLKCTIILISSKAKSMG